LPHEKVLCGIYLFAHDTENPVSHPKFLSEVLS
jgi:hypothetical protein